MKNTEMTLKKKLILLIPFMLLLSSALVCAWIYLSEKWFVIILIGGALFFSLAEVLLNSKSRKDENKP